MKILTKLLTTSLLLFLLPCAVFAGFSGYSYRRTITVDHTQVDTNTLTYTDFPVLVSTTDVTLSTIAANGGHLSNTSGYDLVFSSVSDCSVLLNWSTETYNASTGQVIAWVREPEISSSTDTNLYLCYGNSGVTSFQGNAPNTWTSDYIGVWHLNESGNGTVGEYKESTSKGLNGRGGNGDSAKTPIQITNGKIFNAQRFDASGGSGGTVGKFIAVASTTLLNADSSSFSVSAWVYTSSTTQAQRIVNRYDGAWGFLFDLNATNNLRARVIDNFGTTVDVNTGLVFSSGSWHYVALTLNRTSNALIFYDNGLAVSTASISTLTYPINPPAKLDIGGNEALGTNFFSGFIDEVRYIKSAPTASWLKTEYNNQNSPTTFLAIGSETSAAPSVYVSSPAEGSNYTSPANITIEAVATTPEGLISSVGFYGDGVWLSSDTSDPYSYTWNSVSTGTYVLTARALNDEGYVTISTGVTVSVTHSSPTVSITTPTAGGSYVAPANITIEATATASEGTIDNVKFYEGTNLLYTDTSSPYSYPWTSVSSGTYSLTAVATDSFGAFTTSDAVSITVSETPPVPPSPSSGGGLTLRGVRMHIQGGKVTVW